MPTPIAHQATDTMRTRDVKPGKRAERVDFMNTGVTTKCISAKCYLSRLETAFCVKGTIRERLKGLKKLCSRTA